MATLAGDKPRRFKLWIYSWVAAEISRVTRYYDALVEWPRPGGDTSPLFGLIECPRKHRLASVLDLPVPADPRSRTAVLLNGTLNADMDIEATLSQLRSRLEPGDRAILVLYNPYFSGLYRLADKLGLREGPECTTFLTRSDLDSLARLSGFEVVRIRPAAYAPFWLLGLGTLINKVLPSVPLLRALAFVNVALLRPVAPPPVLRPSLSVIIPARNEKGNILDAITRMPDFRAPLEILFVEGGSSDGTWEEIEKVIRENDGSRFTIRAFKQKGTGKADAVRLGFTEAQGEVLAILDADLTVPPEMLTRFYEACASGLADAVNGSRLLYPMEGGAMRFLNRLGNIFFAKALSFVLDTPLSDSLCGTKVLFRHDWQRVERWKRDFGEFDPFGDFEFLFGCAGLGLRLVNLPVRYRARTYGTTNILRFRHGLMLMRMTLVGLVRVKFASSPARRPLP